MLARERSSPPGCRCPGLRQSSAVGSATGQQPDFRDGWSGQQLERIGQTKLGQERPIGRRQIFAADLAPRKRFAPTTSTRQPARASNSASVDPAGPPPMIRASVLVGRIDSQTSSSWTAGGAIECRPTARKKAAALSIADATRFVPIVVGRATAREQMPGIRPDSNRHGAAPPSAAGSADTLGRRASGVKMAGLPLNAFPPGAAVGRRQNRPRMSRNAATTKSQTTYR